MKEVVHGVAVQVPLLPHLERQVTSTLKCGSQSRPSSLGAR
jgi:hypothetical protein